VPEAAKSIGISSSLMYQLIRDGKVKALEIALTPSGQLERTPCSTFVVFRNSEHGKISNTSFDTLPFTTYV
jgi:hypothetical protein